MSVFRVFKGGMDAEAQLKGTAKAGKEFPTSWDRYPQVNLFAGFIFDLIDRHGCVVTYSPDGANEFPIVVSGGLDNLGNKKFHYFDTAGAKQKMRLHSAIDDPTDNVVSMAVPSRRVESTDPYLSDAVAQFERTDVTEPNKAAYLLGLLLLKRCR